MRNPLSQKITGIQPSGIRKFFDVVNDMPDAISLGVGEPDFETPMNIRTQAIYSLEQGKTFYTSNAGLPVLRQESLTVWRIKVKLYFRKPVIPRSAPGIERVAFSDLAEMPAPSVGTPVNTGFSL